METLETESRLQKDVITCISTWITEGTIHDKPMYCHRPSHHPSLDGGLDSGISWRDECISPTKPYADISPRDTARSSSHRRYISNLTPTHKRACYKCKQYLVLNIIDTEECTIDIVKDIFYELLLSKNLLRNHQNILVC